MAKKKKSAAKPKTVASFSHDDATRKNIPPAEMQSVVQDEVREAIRVAYERRNPDLDPQLIWRGKDDGPLDVPAPPLYIQEKVHPKALVDDLLRQTRGRKGTSDDGYHEADLFADFNGLPEEARSTDFYRHEGHWTNRMILGDGLQVMASLAEREGLRGKVQCIYLDPPYGIKFNSNFQWSTTSRDVKDGNADHISREPEQVKAFRDTWRDGIHSYLGYLRDRLIVARDLLTESGSLFVQIGDENVHRVRAVMDEVFGEENFVSQIATKTSGGSTGTMLSGVTDFILWYGRDRQQSKFRKFLVKKSIGEDSASKYSKVRDSNLQSRTLTREERSEGGATLRGRVYRLDNLTSQSVGREKGEGAASWFEVKLMGVGFKPSQKVRWKTNEMGMERLLKAGRIEPSLSSLNYVRFLDDFAAVEANNFWSDIGGIQSRADPKVYVVQSPTSLIQRCLLMTTDPGDLVLDPTCGSGTTAYVAEQWGRRWITIDTSRVALALARARIMGARYPFYLLADSPEGQRKEAEVTRTAPSIAPTHGKLSHGFVYERVPHITLKSIANNAEIDVIWEQHELSLREHREALTEMIGRDWIEKLRQEAKYDVEVPPEIQEWELPRECPEEWPEEARDLLDKIWQKRIARQREIDASIAAKADSEYLYDRPYEDKSKVRVAGPFTVESLSPHRVLHVDENDEVVDGWKVAETSKGDYSAPQDFATVILDNLRVAGVQQANKEDRIEFTSLNPWPGEYICAEGRYEASQESGGKNKKSEIAEVRAGIFIGPEFGTVARPDLVAAAREAGDAGFDVLIACAFNYDAHSAEFEKLGGLKVLKARMNADLHMASDLKNTGKGNLFVIFGEPDIEILPAEGGGTSSDGRELIQVKINGVDVFHPGTGEVRSSGPEGIACWFLDTDYNEESFFVRHAYFLGQNDPYKSLRTTLKAEIDREAWESLHRDLSRPFPKPSTGRIAVKVINHLGDEVMKVFSA